MNIDEIIKINPSLNIKKVTDESFLEYGRVLKGIDCKDIVKYAEANLEMLEKGTKYTASVKELEDFPIKEELKSKIYGGLEIQIGSCLGKNNSLTGFEYHQGSETVIAVTNLIIMVGKLRDMKGNDYDSSNVETFYVKKGQIVEMYSNTLHYTPCNSDEKGFINLVVLLKGTNTPIEKSDNKILTKKNKYFIAHPSRTDKIKSGAYPGFIGDIPTVKLI